MVRIEDLDITENPENLAIITGLAQDFSKLDLPDPEDCLAEWKTSLTIEVVRVLDETSADDLEPIERTDIVGNYLIAYVAELMSRYLTGHLAQLTEILVPPAPPTNRPPAEALADLMSRIEKSGAKPDSWYQDPHVSGVNICDQDGNVVLVLEEPVSANELNNIRDSYNSVTQGAIEAGKNIEKQRVARMINSIASLVQG